MKFNKVVKREFKAIYTNPAHSDYIGEGTTTKAVEMHTGYRGHGLQGMGRTFPAGTEVRFYLRSFHLDELGTVTDLDITTDYERETYRTSHRMIMDLETAANLLGLDKLVTKVNKF